MSKILDILYAHQDVKYGDFISKLVPNMPRSHFIGIRSPEFKKIVKEIHEAAEDEVENFIATLPHQFHEENVVHVSLISEEKDFDLCVKKMEDFIPYITNWAVSDGINPKVFDKNHEKLAPYVKKWINSDLPYSKRVAMRFILAYYLKDDFKSEYLDWAAEIRSEEYYVNMMTAWLFAEALVKQWDSAIAYIQNNKLAVWTHNKAIQKARESFRITPEQKEYLKSLKRK